MAKKKTQEVVAAVDFYAIERIIRSRANPNGQLEYLIKWKDRPESENSWQSVNNLYSERKSPPAANTAVAAMEMVNCRLVIFIRSN